MKAEAGALVRITYDAGNEEVRAGDGLRTRTGRSYLIVEAVRQKRGRPDRYRLNCVVWPAGQPLEPRVFHPLIWYKRERRRGRALGETATNKPVPAAPIPTSKSEECVRCGGLGLVDPWENFDRTTCPRCAGTGRLVDNGPPKPGE